MMYISRMLLTERGIHDLIAVGNPDPYWIHRFIWKSFPDTPAGARPFLYNVADDRRSVICVSSVRPDNADGRWDVETKDYTPHLTTGTALGFHLHANPTATNERTGRHQRHSVIMNARKTGRENLKTPLADVISSAVTEWMVRKGSLNGFSVDRGSLMVSAYRREQCKKKNGRPITITTVDIDGTLTVEDPDLLQKALFSGIGTSKGLGCGLLLVRRI